MYEKITHLMEERGLTAYQVTKEAKLSPNAFTEWKKEKAKPSLDSLRKLANYFGVSIEYFLED